MKRLIILIQLILVLTACENDDQVPEQIIRFSGTISNGDNGQLMSDVKVKLKLDGTDLSSNQFVTIWDSTITDDLGNYSFKKRINRGKIYVSDYSIIPIKEYFENCLGSSSDFIPMGFLFSKQIDTLNVNADSRKMCHTGQIRLVLEKLQSTNKDTLFFRQTYLTTSFPVLASRQYSTLPSDKIDLKYFTRNVISVEFLFTVKKENGLITESKQSVTLQPGSTKELEIHY